MPRTPGGYLRKMLEEAAEPGDEVYPPAIPRSTLYEDLKVLRAGGTDQKPSG